ncbi:hypothetical protein J6590_060760 [Homalodisca vitripennis]|nr:hypothetical protein J6590_060760 [Homalodisca vitripennis]
MTLSLHGWKECGKDALFLELTQWVSGWRKGVTVHWCHSRFRYRVVSKQPFKGSRVRRSPVKPSSKETRRSDSRSTVPAWDPLSTPSEAGKKLIRQFYDVDLQSVYRQFTPTPPLSTPLLLSHEAVFLMD